MCSDGENDENTVMRIVRNIIENKMANVVMSLYKPVVWLHLE